MPFCSTRVNSNESVEWCEERLELIHEAIIAETARQFHYLSALVLQKCPTRTLRPTSVSADEVYEFVYVLYVYVLTITVFS